MQTSLSPALGRSHQVTPLEHGRSLIAGQPSALKVPLRRAMMKDTMIY
jgi:hypothetical protein